MSKCDVEGDHFTVGVSGLDRSMLTTFLFSGSVNSFRKTCTFSGILASDPQEIWSALKPVTVVVRDI